MTANDTFDAAARELREARIAMRDALADDRPMKVLAEAAKRLGRARARMLALSSQDYPLEVE